MRKRMIRQLLVSTALMVAIASDAAETLIGKVSRDEHLRAQADTDAESLAEVTRGDVVTILERQGGWYHVRLASESNIASSDANTEQKPTSEEKRTSKKKKKHTQSDTEPAPDATTTPASNTNASTNTDQSASAIAGSQDAPPKALEGWLRIYWVRTGSGETSSAGLATIGDAARMTTSKRTSNDIVANLGVRGIDEEQLKAAHFDAAQIAALEKNTVSDGDAKKFASAVPLRTHEVKELAAGRKP